jgi:hypothetical protein
LFVNIAPGFDGALAIDLTDELLMASYVEFFGEPRIYEKVRLNLESYGFYAFYYS